MKYRTTWQASSKRAAPLLQVRSRGAKASLTFRMRSSNWSRDISDSRRSKYRMAAMSCMWIVIGNTSKYPVIQKIIMPWTPSAKQEHFGPTSTRAPWSIGQVGPNLRFPKSYTAKHPAKQIPGLKLTLGKAWHVVSALWVWICCNL